MIGVKDVAGYGNVTQTAGTLINRVVEPHAGLRTIMKHLQYLSSTTAHTLLRSLGRTALSAAANRTNLYVLALAYSSVGKEWPRKVNTCVMHRVGLVGSLGEKFASGEGIQDALHGCPAMLFQTEQPPA